ncbi:MAG: LrgB family protein [Burkholderiaceae bacterium]
MTELRDIWAYLNETPLLHLTITLAAFQLAGWVYEKASFNPLLNPVLLTVILVVSFLLLSGTDYREYFEGAKFIHFLLGPATVALAIPLYKQFQRVRQSGLAIGLSILAGSMTATVTAVGVGYLLNGSPDILISLAPKSVTAPVAMGISEQLGGLPSLTAVLVLLTGILGAVLGPFVLDLMKETDWPVRGLAIGLAAHGIGTARAMQVNSVAGAFAGLAMGLNALATAILLPVVWGWFF